MFNNVPDRVSKNLVICQFACKMYSNNLVIFCHNLVILSKIAHSKWDKNGILFIVRHAGLISIMIMFTSAKCSFI